MKYLILFLLLSGCASHNEKKELFSVDEIIYKNSQLIQYQIDHCGDIICESSEPITEERIMEDIRASLKYDWENLNEKN